MSKIKHEDILKSLESINFDAPETIETLNFIEKKSVIDMDIPKTKEKEIKFFSNVNKYYEPDNISSLFEKVLFDDMKTITENYKSNYNRVNDLLIQEKIIQEEYKNITKDIQDNDKIIKSFIDFYSNYLKENKSFLIKNEILKTFLEKILLSKEERESLSTANEDKIDFKIVQKLEILKNNVDIIQQNSTNFSKTLVQSIKKYYSAIDEMINEKIVVYLKNSFKSFDEKLSLKEFKEILTLLNFLNNKEQYINFVLKEYVNMRKKFCENIIKEKYLALSSKNIDNVYTSLNEDFMFYFMKELILICFFFLSDNKLSIISIDEAYQLFIFHEDEEKNVNIFSKSQGGIEEIFEKLENILRPLGKIKEKIFIEKYISNLNSILYVFDTLFFEYTQKKELQFYQVYKFTLLSFYFSEKLENILNETELQTKNKTFNSTFLTNRNNFSSILRSYENEEIKELNKFKENIINYLKDSQVLITNESMINQKINALINNYKIIFDLYQKYKPKKEENDTDLVNPNRHELYLCMLDFFDNNEQIENETNLEILFKVINLLQLLNTNFKTEKNIRLFNKLLDKSVKIILDNTFKDVKFEENLRQNKNQDQIVNIIEEMMDKIQLNLIDINYIQDFNVKETIKEKIKEQIKSIYQKTLNEIGNSISITEEKLNNYLDII